MPDDRPRSYSGTPIDATPEELAAVSDVLARDYEEYAKSVHPEVPPGGWVDDAATWPEATVGAPDPEKTRERIIGASSDPA